MARRPSQSALPPPLEVACLAALWEAGEADVHQVVERLQARHKLAHTTVMTLLDRLVKRGRLVRRKQGRRYIYEPAEDARLVREAALTEFADLYFGGSREALRAFVNGTKSADTLFQQPEPAIDTALL
jgi:BlaI family transcriptional regulator, penicillinase repressor